MPASHPDSSSGIDEADHDSLHALVEGRVQGVGFRMFVATRARGLGLTGQVRNLADGRVEVHAAGSRSALESLEAALHQGPAIGRVDRVQAEWSIPMESDSDFRVGS